MTYPLLVLIAKSSWTVDQETTHIFTIQICGAYRISQLQKNHLLVHVSVVKWMYVVNLSPRKIIAVKRCGSYEIPQIEKYDYPVLTVTKKWFSTIDPYHWMILIVGTCGAYRILQRWKFYFLVHIGIAKSTPAIDLAVSFPFHHILFWEPSHSRLPKLCFFSIVFIF